ncbi:MAG: glutamate ABC transporter substrate-binding protein [Nocardiopsaceae bacterium]|nr:glutamate ABC transporter substrate-binding protein [Nocardiopsaceae bacterium]
MTGRTGRPGRATLTAAVLAAAAVTAAGCTAPAASQKPASQQSAGQQSAGQRPASQAAGRPAAGTCDPEASSPAPSRSPGAYVARIRARGYLIAGVDQSTYHFGFLNPTDGKIEGFDIDMVDAVAQAIFGASYQSRIQFKAISDADRVPALQSGAVDIVAHTMTITCQRLRQIDFSSVYYDARAELLVLSDSAATGLADLKGQNVCATSGSDDVAVIARYHARPVQARYWTDCLVDLQQGQVAGIVTDDSILHGLSAQDPFTRIIARPLESEPYGLGISKAHGDFARFVNGVLARIRASGQWKADYTHWVGGPAPAPPAAHYAA